MLKGEDGGQCADLAKMTSWLKKNMKPDLIYLSNCLLIGLAGTLKKELNLPIICALQDEDTWIDELPREYQDLCWSEIKSRIQDVDLFFPPSRYFAERMQKLLEIPATKIEILPSGIDYGSYKDIEPAFDSPAIGFLSRLSPLNGLELLIEAFIKIKASEGLKKTKLLLAGGYTKDDLPFLKKMKKNLLQAGLLDSVSFREGFSPKERYDFFKQLTVFTVPAPAGNAFGIFQLEASLAQVPVVLPDTGAFPEVLALTQGGSTFQSGNVDSLVTALTAFLTNPVVAGIVGRRGRQGVKKFFETRTITARMIKVMEDLIVENGRKNQTYVRMSEPK
jgi:glycosyltransferase involved in cell wall biosynthesis